MAKAPLKISKIASLPVASVNPGASLMPKINWAGVETEAHVVVGGGATTEDPRSLQRLRAGNDEEDVYVESVVSYTEEDKVVTRASLSALSDSREYIEVAPMLNCVFFAGGQDEKGFSRVVEMYDSFGGHRILTPLDVARTDMASAGLGTNVLFAGGDDGSGASDRIDIYQVNFMKRFAGLSLPLPVRGLCGCSFGNYAVFAGGRDAKGIPTDKVIAFDKNMNIISNIEPLSEPRYNLAAAVCTNPENSYDSYLLIAGGKSTHTGFSTVVDVYDSNLKKVAAGLELTQGRSRLKGASCGGYALFAGGVVGVEPNDTPTNIVDIFDFRLKRFEPMYMPEAKNSLSAAAFTNKVIFAGGYNAQGASKTVYTFSLDDGQNYATVVYHFPSALAQYNFGE